MNSLLVLLVLFLGGAFQAGWAGDVNGPDQNCQSCHAGSKTKLHFPDGSSWSVQVDERQINDSIHGGRLGCSDCHQGKWGSNHPKEDYKSARDFRIRQSETCKRCHFAHYTRQLDGIHFKKLDAGRSDAPTCVDCHGAHNVQNPKNPRVEMNRKCADCHGEVFAKYKNSVHGKALTESNQDHPLCIDCHGAHKIENPNGMSFRASVHLVCGKCHGNAERMKKYNLNPNVLSTYLDDFHGMSNQLYQTEGATGAKPFKQIATCIDCHGAHDVMSLRKATSKGEIQKRILTSCTACHKDAKLLMADAWLSHQKPTRQTAPLVWLVKKVYGILIPMIMAGLVLHILLHLWRLRARRSGSEK